jgi:hypothetical protein
MKVSEKEAMRVYNEVKMIRLHSTFKVAVCMLTLLLGLSGSAMAATTSKTQPTSINNNSNSLKISPLRTDLTLKAGDSGVVSVYVTNITGDTVLLQPIENDFVAGDEKGTPALILDENSYAPSHSLKRFMVPLSNVTIAPHATATVNLTISVPSSAQAGGYYGALRFAPAGAGSGTVALSSSLASLVLLTVPGPTVEQLTLTNFDIQQNGGTASNFRTPNDISLSLRFQNKGNLQEAPFGQINVLKGKKVLYSANFNQSDPRNEILPDSARRWILPLKGMGKFGKYTVVGTFGYGAKGQTINIQKTVWIIPTTYIIAAVVGLLALIVIVGGSYMFLRSYKRKILRSSRRRY